MSLPLVAQLDKQSIEKRRSARRKPGRPYSAYILCRMGKAISCQFTCPNPLPPGVKAYTSYFPIEELNRNEQRKTENDTIPEPGCPCFSEPVTECSSG